MFPDPFYSPGSDFIALENGFTTMAILRDFRGEDISPYIKRFSEMMLAVDDYTVSLYRDASHIQTKPHVFLAKLFWDNYGYWSFLCPYYFQGVYRWSAEDHDRFQTLGRQFGALVPKGQKLLAAWARFTTERSVEKYSLVPNVPSTLANLHFQLQEEHTADEFLDILQQRYNLFEDLYQEFILRALKDIGPDKAPDFLKDAEIHEINIDDNRLNVDEKGGRASYLVRDLTRTMGPATSDGDNTMRSVLTAIPTSTLKQHRL